MLYYSKDSQIFSDSESFKLLCTYIHELYREILSTYILIYCIYVHSLYIQSDMTMWLHTYVHTYIK